MLWYMMSPCWPLLVSTLNLGKGIWFREQSLAVQREMKREAVLHSAHNMGSEREECETVRETGTEMRPVDKKG